MTEVTVVVQDTPDVSVSVVNDVVVATILTIAPTVGSSVSDPITNTSINQIVGTTEQSMLISPVGPNPVPANGLAGGRVLKIRTGGLHTESPSPLSVTFKVKLNGADIGVGVNANIPNRGTNAPWWLEIDIEINGVGASVGYSAVVKGQFKDGTGAVNSVLGASTYSGGINTTIDNTIDVTAQWSGAGGQLDIYSFSLEHVGGNAF